MRKYGKGCERRERAPSRSPLKPALARKRAKAAPGLRSHFGGVGLARRRQLAGFLREVSGQVFNCRLHVEVVGHAGIGHKKIIAGVGAFAHEVMEGAVGIEFVQQFDLE